MSKGPAPMRLIRTEDQYAAALVDYERFFDHEPEPGSAEGDRFELLGVLLQRYEEERFPIGQGDPVEVVRSVMDARRLSQADLAALFGSRSRASEVLNRKRDLSMEQVRRLHREWHIPAEALIGETRRA